MISTLYNMLGWIFIVLAHWKNIVRVDLLLQLDTFYWFRNQPVFVLTQCCVFCGAAADFNCIVFALVWPDCGSNPRCTTLKVSMLSITPQVLVFEMNTTLKVSMLSITPQRWLYLKWTPRSRWACYPLHHWWLYLNSNPRCTTLKVSMLSITPQVVVLEMNILMKCRFNVVQYKWKLKIYDFQDLVVQSLK